MGLGSFPDRTLAKARERAREYRQQLQDGIDPLAERRRQQQERIAEVARAVTFRQDAEAYMALHDHGWSRKHAEQWRRSLKNYVYPRIGHMVIRDITSADVRLLVEPLWIEKTVTATRVLDRIAIVLDYAAAHGHRQGDNPAHIRASLPKPNKITTVENFAAVPYQQIGAVLAEIRKIETPASKALQFLILCASRAGEVRGCTWDEIDAHTWKIPGKRMKGGKEHHVPLSPQALELLKAMPRNGDRVFPILDQHAMRRVLAKATPNGTVHGMRATFRTWCLECTSFPPKLAEAALAHRLGADKTEEAYLRGTLFEKRRKLMEAWATYCTKPAIARGEVVPIREAHASA